MNICPVCGAQMEDTCKFDVPREEAPWINDYFLMATGQMSHQAHQLMVARWNLHHLQEISQKVLSWSKAIIQKNNSSSEQK